MRKLLIVLLAGPPGFIAAVLIGLALLGPGRDFNDTGMATGMLLLYVIGPLGFAAAAIAGVVAVRRAGDWWLLRPASLAAMLAVMGLGLGGAGWFLFREPEPEAPRIDGRRIALEIAFRARAGYVPPPPERRWAISLHLEPYSANKWAPVFLDMEWPPAGAEGARVVIRGITKLDYMPAHYVSLQIHASREAGSYSFQDIALPTDLMPASMAWTAWRPGCDEPSCAAAVREFDLTGLEWRFRIRFAEGE